MRVRNGWARRVGRAGALVVAVGLVATSCASAPTAAPPQGASQPSASSAPTETPTTPRSPTPTPTPSPKSTETSAPTRSAATPTGVATPTTSGPTSEAAPARSCVDTIVDGLSDAERAGQLLMVGLDVNAGSDSLDDLVSQKHLSGVVLLGGWHAGVATTAATTEHLSSLSSEDRTGGLGLFIAADQEGGAVQQLQGDGFEVMPSALDQGGLTDAALRQDAERWGKQIAAAGVNVNLAPVADTVPVDIGTQNQPIGRWDREYSHHSEKVSAKSGAFLAGMHDAGIATTVKHFPGLGRITGNTDLTATGITDSVTTMHDPYLDPFRAGIAAHTDFVMVGSAIYSQIDPGVNAVFSHRIVTDLLREDLGFEGVVVSDDVGAAKSVAGTPVGERATRFIAAGGDIVLTALPSTVPTMHRAITQEIASNTAFADQVELAVTRVVQLKVDRGLASCGG